MEVTKALAALQPLYGKDNRVVGAQEVAELTSGAVDAERVAGGVFMPGGIQFETGPTLAYLARLATEAGVHRLVRISPFNSGGSRETSFASMFVSPEIDENIEVDIQDKDLRVDTYRSSGAGGQHVNVTDSAVRITHMPSGIVVTCQNQRSQIQNRAVAMQVLRSKLYELELEKRRADSAELEATKMDISFGSQIRNYVLHPYRLVKDTRTKFELTDVDAVLDGDIDEFIKEFLLFKKGAAVAR